MQQQMSMAQRCENVRRSDGASHNSSGISGSSSCGGGAGGGGGGGVVDSLNDQQSSIRVSKLRPLARLDRLLRRWLPGYNFLRGCGGNGAGTATGTGHANGRQSPESDAVLMPPMRAMAETDGGQQTPPPLPPRRRRDGEVYLDAGIAKSEFCTKLERLLQAKLIDKD